jgi:hypothetical protein
MHTVKRRIFNVLTAVSLVVCLASAALWAMSYTSLGDPYGIKPLSDWQVGINDGQLFVIWWPAPETQFTTRGDSGWRLSYLTTIRSFYGYGGPTQRWWTWVVSLWFPTLLCALPPLAWVLRLRGARRVSSDRCIRCGYDMRATPDRCPECGTAVAPVG